MSDTNPLERAELALAHRIADLREHRLVKAAEPISKVADQPPMLALSGATFVAGWLLRKPRLMEAGARVFASVLTATAIKSVVKDAFARTRPRTAVEEGRYETHAKGSAEKSEQSFPSGHTADAVAAARAAVHAAPSAAAPAYGFAAAVSVLQPMQAKHYPTDVAAGALIGFAAEALVHLALTALSRGPEEPAG